MNQIIANPLVHVEQEDFMSTRAPKPAVAPFRAAGLTWAAVVAVTFIVVAATPALAQFNSGSSGVHGVFPPAPVPNLGRYLLWDLKTGLIRYCSEYDTVTRPSTCTTEVGTAQIPGIPAGGLTTGIYQFSNFDLSYSPSIGVLDLYPVGYDGPVPLTILSQNVFRIAGVYFHLEGHNGASTQTGLPPTGYGAPGAMPGPGGFFGGNGGKLGAPSTAGAAGSGPGGGEGGAAGACPGCSGLPGAIASPTPVSTTLVPLVGGSGGGGGGASDTVCGFRGGGGGGGGGGGALLVAANVRIAIEGYYIYAVGGNGGAGCSSGYGGAGSGGSVRLVAPLITGSAYIYVGQGIVRIEGNSGTYAGYIDTLRGTVLAAPQSVIPSDFPTLRITSVGGIAVGANPTGVASTPDVTFATAPSGPVTVNLAASSVPAGTKVDVRASPLVGAATTATSTALTGPVQNSTATASLTIPPGAGVITAVTSFPVTTAMLDRLPQIPGLKPSLIEVTADAFGTSRLFVIGEDSRRVELKLGTDGRFAVAN